MKKAVWLLCACALDAQTVKVTGSVTNAITHEPIGSVSVLLLSAGPTLGANSDASGRFRISDVKAGRYRLIPSRSGFDAAAREIRIETGADPPPFDLTMTPWPGLRGRVLDPQRQTVARARVRAIMSGGDLVYEAITDGAGCYAFDSLHPGEYTLLAAPPAALDPAGPAEPAPTYFPSVTDARDALPLQVAAGYELSAFDIVLRAVQVFRVSGKVLDEHGNPAAGATVQSPLSERKTTARGDGTFDLARVRRGEGSLRADWQRGDAQLRGVAKVTVRSDVDDLTVRVSPPVAFSGTVELDGQPHLSCEGEAYLRPVDGQGETAQAEFNESGIRFDRVYPGHYRLIVQPGWAFSRHYLESVRLGDRDITLDELEVAPGMTPFRVLLKTHGGHIRGTVENGNGGLVVLTPKELALRFRPFIVTAPFEGATFDLDNVRPGDYYAFALRGAFFAGEMQNPAYARPYLDAAITVRVERNSTVTLAVPYVNVPLSQ